MSLHVTITTVSDVGRRRNRNEDAVAADGAHAILVVADGMGGHPAGDVASRMAVEEALRVLRPAADSRPSDPASRGNGGERMARAVRSADERIREEGLKDPERAGMGTTLTALQLDAPGRRFHVGHVGDSRAYRFRDHHLEQITRDDTWVQSQVDAGRITPAQARVHPWSSLLTQAVGLEPPAEPSVVVGEVDPDDLFLVCSDGLITHLTDEQMVDILERHLPEGLGEVAQALVDAANAEGGLDNITVGLLHVEPDADVTEG